MQRFFEIVKNNPLLILGAVVAVVIVIWIAGRGGGEASSGGVLVVGPSDAGIEANKQVTIAQMAQQAEASRNSATIELARITSDAALKADANANSTAIALATIESAVYGANNQATLEGMRIAAAADSQSRAWDSAIITQLAQAENASDAWDYEKMKLGENTKVTMKAYDASVVSNLSFNAMNTEKAWDYLTQGRTASAATASAPTKSLLSSYLTPNSQGARDVNDPATANVLNEEIGTVSDPERTATSTTPVRISFFDALSKLVQRSSPPAVSTVGN